MHVVIVGCGRVGATLATMLGRGGHSVAIVDQNSQAFERLPNDFTGDTVIGTGIDEDVLRRAGIEHAECLRRGDDGGQPEHHGGAGRQARLPGP